MNPKQTRRRQGRRVWVLEGVTKIRLRKKAAEIFTRV